MVPDTYKIVEPMFLSDTALLKRSNLPDTDVIVRLSAGRWHHGGDHEERERLGSTDPSVDQIFYLPFLLKGIKACCIRPASWRRKSRTHRRFPIVIESSPEVEPAAKDWLQPFPAP